MGYYNGSNAYKDYIPQNNVNRNYNTYNRASTVGYTQPKRESSASRPKTVQTETPKRSKRTNSAAQKLKYMRSICAILVLALSAGYMISKFVTVQELRREVRSLQVELAKEQAVSSQKIFKLESSVDLSEIEDEAYTRLNMQRPEKYQIVYVDVPCEDKTDTTAGEVEGVVNNVKAFFARTWKNIVEAFSIE